MLSRCLRFVGLTGVVGCAMALNLASLKADTLFRDNFDCTLGSSTNDLITSAQYYIFTNFPHAGTSSSDNPSKSWEMGTGNAFATNGWLFFGTPRGVGTSNYVRFNSQRRDYMNAGFSWLYRSGGWGGQDGYANDPAQAVDLWLRYQTEYDLYIIQFDKFGEEADRIRAKRKVPACGWSGPD